MITVLTAVGIAYVGLACVLFVSQRAVLYPGATGGPAPLSDWGQPVEIATEDGERLFALHVPAASGHPTVLFFHGNGDRVDRYGFLARELSDRNIGFLALSYRGFPGSTGSPTEAGLIADGAAARDWLGARSPDGVILLGQSLGSGVAVAVARSRETAGLVLISAFDSVLAVARKTYPFLPVARLLKDPFRSDERIVGLAMPKLFIHGRRDTLVPLSSGEALFATATAPKRMIVIDHAGHNDVWSEQVMREIVDFVEATAGS